MKILNASKNPEYETLPIDKDQEYVTFRLSKDERFSDVVYHYTIITPVEGLDEDGNEIFYLRFEYNIVKGEVLEELREEFEQEIASVLYHVVVSYAEDVIETHKRLNMFAVS
jgi:hypothetical protein